MKKKQDKEKQATKKISHPLATCMVNIILQRGKDAEPFSQQVLHDDIESMVEKMQSSQRIMSATLESREFYNAR